MRHLLIALTILLLPAWAAAQDWPEVARDVKAQEPLAQAQAGETRSLLAQDKAAVDKDMAALQASIASKQQAFDALKARYDELMEQEDALNEELAQQAHEIKTIDGTIRTSAKQARDYFHESLTAPEFPDRAATLDRILTPDRFPGLGGIQSLLALYLGEMKASGEVVRWQGSFTGTNGKEARGQVVRVGAFTAAYRTASG